MADDWSRLIMSLWFFWWYLSFMQLLLIFCLKSQELNFGKLIFVILYLCLKVLNGLHFSGLMDCFQTFNYYEMLWCYFFQRGWCTYAFFHYIFLFIFTLFSRYNHVITLTLNAKVHELLFKYQFFLSLRSFWRHVKTF